MLIAVHVVSICYVVHYMYRITQSELRSVIMSYYNLLQVNVFKSYLQGRIKLEFNLFKRDQYGNDTLNCDAWYLSN
jgi:hypothetical protein